MGDTFQDLQWISETADSTKPVYTIIFPMIKLNL